MKLLLSCALYLACCLWFSFSAFAQPANDFCSGATTLAQDGSCSSGTTVGAGDEWIGTVGCQSGNNREVWYTFIANNTQANFTITSGTLTGNIELVVVASSTADCLGNLTIVGAQCGPSVLTDSFNTVVGTTYYVTISSSTNSQGTFNICLTSSAYVPQPGQDCSTASVLCDNTPFSQATSNAGFGAQEVTTANSCWVSGGERQSKWYKFSVGCSGTLGFSIKPNVLTDDYDWALWDITSSVSNCSSKGNSVACNWSGCPGSTGLSSNAAGESGAVSCAGPGDACSGTCGGYRAWGNWDSPYGTCNGCGLLNVTAGNTYALLIDNFSTSNNGFAFTFSGTATIGPDATFSIAASNCNKTITVTKDCPTSNSTYLWNFGDGFTSTSAGPITHTYASPNTYTVSLSVTDALGCTKTYSQEVSQPDISIVPPSSTICNGDSVTLSGSIDVQPATTSVTFTNGTDVNIPNNDAIVGANSNITVSGISPASLSAGMIASVCFTVNHGRHADLGNGGAVADAITLTSPGGTIYNFTPLPSSGSGSVTYCFPIATLDGVTGNPNGVWTIHIEDNVNKTGGTTHSGTLTDWTIIFNNSNVATYAWSPTTNMTGSGTLSPTVFPTGNATYTLTATDAFACVFSDSVTITVNALPAAPTAAGVTICSGSTATLTATAPGGTYQWYSAATGGILLNTGASYTTPSLSSAATYYVQTTLNGCTSASRTAVTVSLNPDIVVSNINTTCSGDNLSYTVTFDITGGNPASYSVTGGSGTLAGGTFTSNSISSGTPYSFTVSDIYDCAPISVSGSKNCACSASASVSGGGTVCTGTNAPDIVFTLAGTGPWNLTYNINGVPQAPVIGIAASPYSITTPGAGAYTISAVSDAGCTGSGSGSATVAFIALPTAIVSGGGSVCDDGSTSDVSIALTGLSPWSVTYNDGTADSTVTGVGSSPFIISTSTAGTYTVVNVTGASTCSNTGSGSATVIVNPLPAPTISASGPVSFCLGDSVTLTSTAASSYSWSTGATSQTIVVSSAGTYSVTVTDANSCTGASGGTVVTIFSLPAPTITNTTPLSFCSGDSVILTSSPATSYFWSTAETTQSIVASTPGNYSVTVTDGNGCEGASANKNVTVFSNPVAVITPSGPTSFCSGGLVTLTSGAASNYLWSTTESTQSISVNSSGTFSVVITDGNGCVDSASVSVTSFPNPTSVTSSTNENCGLSDGNAIAAGSGGTSPYTYLWDSNAGSQTNDTASGLAAGTYAVTVYDANSCTSFNSATVNSASGLSATLAPTNVSCNSAADGTAIISPSGGTSPYTFLWSGGQTNDTITGLSGGTIGITVTDSVGCTYVDTKNIIEPSALSIPVSTIAVTCNGDGDGMAVVAPSGGTSPYSFLWAGGSTNDTISSLAGGTFGVTVTDANGCIETGSGTVSEPSALSVSATSTPVTCNGSGNGTATATAVGGNLSYGYVWSNGQTNATATGLSGGIYSVTATDNKGCTATNTVTVSEPNAISGTITVDSASCNGLSDGSASINPSGGTSPFSFSWTGGQTTGTATGLGAGTYSIAVTDSNGCVYSTFATVNEPALLSTTTTKTDVLCNNGSTGSATAIPAGGTSPYSFLWSNGQTGITDTSLTASTYNVTVTDANGCTATSSAIISQPSAISISVTSVAANCGQPDGQVSSTPSGGISPYTYLWTGGQTDSTATSLSAGNYTVTVTDSNSCTKTATATVSNAGGFTGSASATDASCSGFSDGQASAIPSGGTAPFSYQWDANASNQTDSTATGLSAGTYSVTISDNLGCTFDALATVSEPAVLTVSLTPVNVLCNGGGNGQISTTVSGGTMSYTYLWSNSQAGSTATGLPAGTFYVTVTDNNGCTQNDSAAISEPAAISTSSSSAICSGDSIFLQGSFQTAAGIYYDTLSSVNGCDSAVTTTLSLNTSYSIPVSAAICSGDSIFLQGNYQDVAGTYYDTLVTYNGCDSVFVTALSVYSSYSIPQSSVICSGDSIFLQGNYQTAAGTFYDTLSTVNGCDSVFVTSLTVNAAYSVQLSSSICPGDSIFLQGAYQTSAGTYYDTLSSVFSCDSIIETTLSLNSVFSTPASASICSGDSIFLQGAFQNAPGIYYDTLYTVNGCDSIVATSLTVNSSSSSAASAQICAGDSIFLQGSYQTSPGTFYDTLAGSNGCDSIIVTTLSVNPTSSSAASAAICAGDSLFVGGSFQSTAGVYYDTLTGVNGCDSILATTLAVLPVSSSSSSIAICSGDSIFLQGSYQSTPGFYFDTLAAANGCDSVITTILSVNPSSSSALSSSICEGDSIFLQGSYQNSAGTYYDTLSSATGCDSIIITTLSISLPPSDSIAGITSFCAGGSSVLTAIESGAGTTYLWSPGGETTNSITVITSGTFSVTVVNGCGQDSNSVDVTISPAPAADAGNDTTVFQDTEVKLTASGGYSYVWSTVPAETTPSVFVTPETTTTYYVTVTNVEGCSDIDSVTVTIDFKYIIFIPNMFSPNTDGTNDVLWIRGLGIKELKWVIFDRWGEKVYDSGVVQWTGDKTIGWDGKFKGKEVNAAVFVYMLEATMDDGSTISKKGDITVVK